MDFAKVAFTLNPKNPEFDNQPTLTSEIYQGLRHILVGQRHPCKMTSLVTRTVDGSAGDYVQPAEDFDHAIELLGDFGIEMPDTADVEEFIFIVHDTDYKKPGINTADEALYFELRKLAKVWGIDSVHQAARNLAADTIKQGVAIPHLKRV